VHDVRYFARQPIVDRAGRTFAYEVLFRADGRTPVAAFVDGTAETRSVLEALDRYGDDLCDGRMAFVSLPRQALVDRFVRDLDPWHIGCEILEDVRPDPEVVAALDELRTAGFSIALDDFGPGASRQGLVTYADIVKLDIRQFGVERLRPVVSRLQRGGARVLAEKVETVADLAGCHDAGFDLFQGYAVGKPATLPLAALQPGRLLRRVWRGVVAPVRARLPDPLTP
jgi:c-di-GMP phosphodiesterase